MSQSIREQVSALLDGELADTEMGLLVRRLERDPDLRGAFGRYALIGESLRAPGDRLAAAQFSQRVAAAIDDGLGDALAGGAGDAVAAPTRRLRVPLALGGLAAGVGALAVALLMVREPDSAAVTAATFSEETELAPIRIDTTRIAVGAADTLVGDDEGLTPYMIAHAQYAAPAARRYVLTNVIADDPGISPEELPVVLPASTASTTEPAGE